MILRTNNIHRKVSVVILIPAKRDFEITKVMRDKDGHLIMIQGTDTTSRRQYFLIYMHPSSKNLNM